MKTSTSTRLKIKFGWNEFHSNLSKQSFMPSTNENQSSRLQQYALFIANYCSNPMYSSYLGSCCDQKSAPFPPEQLRKCAPGIELVLQQLQTLHSNQNGPIFDKVNNVIGYYFRVYTTREFSMSYEIMDGYYSEIQHFLDTSLATAPLGFKSGFFLGDGWL